MLICHLYTFFSEVSAKVFGSILNRVAFSLLCFEFFVLFWVTVLYQMCLLQNIFSQSVICFTLMALSFAQQKFIILVTTSFSIISFMDCVISKKSLPYLMSSRFSPLLYSRSFIVLCFTFWPTVYSELIFVRGERSVSRFIFLHVDVYCSNTIG